MFVSGPEDVKIMSFEVCGSFRESFLLLYYIRLLQLSGHILLFLQHAFDRSVNEITVSVKLS